MEHFFEQLKHILENAELIGILLIVLIISLITLNIIACICVISMSKSLKRIAKKYPEHEPLETKLNNKKYLHKQKALDENPTQKLK
ncbi:MAG: hypothetical protein Q4A79_01175 [Candidatus Saccharibacteria bacterium]|nr:hypothetical protein [Candidatus Saccharibacteria bacterium]